MYPTKMPKVCLTDSGHCLSLSEVIMGEQAPHDPIVALSSNLPHKPLYHFVIVPTENGAFQSSDMYQPELACLDFYSDEVRFAKLKHEILAWFIHRFDHPNELIWMIRIIPWNDGVAVSVVCGCEEAMALIEEKVK
jgi:hypothetical protein